MTANDYSNGSPLMKRNSSIEFLRVLLMLGICVLHAIYHGGNRVSWLSNGLRWCVDGFVFISGWYGIRFKPSKMIRLISLAIVASCIAIGVGILVGVWDVHDSQFFKSCYRVVTGHWFLCAYLVLMFVSPVLNICLNKIDTIEERVAVAIPFVMLAIWSWLYATPIVGALVPNTAGIGDYTGLSLITVYLFAGTLKRIGADRLPIHYLVVAIVATYPFCVLGFGGYASPFAMILSAAIFLAVLKMHLSNWLDRIATFAAPSMFAILLISQKEWFTYKYINEFENVLIDKLSFNSILACILTGALMFLVAFALDMPRRILTYAIRPIAKKVYEAVDNKYTHLECSIAQFMSTLCRGGVILNLYRPFYV